METFLFLEKKVKSEKYSTEVTRIRTSKNFASISIKFAGQTISFTNQVIDDYEFVVRELIDLLNKVVNDPCNLPQTKNEKEVLIDNFEMRLKEDHQIEE